MDFGDVHPGTQPHISRSRHRKVFAALKAVWSSGQGGVGVGRQLARQELRPIMGDFERRGATAWRSRLVGEPGSRKPAVRTSSLPQCSSVLHDRILVKLCFASHGGPHVAPLLWRIRQVAEEGERLAGDRLDRPA